MDNLHDFNNLNRKQKASVQRPDGQPCPVEEKIDDDTGEIDYKVKSPKFYAFNHQNYKAKLNLAIHHPMPNAILEFFISEMDNTNAICVSMAVLEKVFGMTRQALRVHIAFLVEKKFIEIFKIGNMNAYAVNAYVVFTQGEANLWKAKFVATMYLDYEEQTTQVKSKYAKVVEEKGSKKRKLKEEN